MILDTFFALGILALIALAFGIAAAVEVYVTPGPDSFTLKERLRAAKDNLVFAVVQKASASARLVKLLASVVFCAPFIAVGLAAVIVGSVLAFTRPVNRVVTFGFLTGYERVNDWLKPLLAGAAAPVERALAR